MLRTTGAGVFAGRMEAVERAVVVDARLPARLFGFPKAAKAHRSANEAISRLAGAIRWTALVVVSMQMALGRAVLTELVSGGAVLGYSVFRTLRPLRPTDHTSRERPILGAIAIEVSLIFFFVVYSGGWSSPFVVSLGASLLVAGLVAGMRGAGTGLFVLMLGWAIWWSATRAGADPRVLAERIAAMAAVAILGAHIRHLHELERVVVASEERGRIARDLHDGLGQSLAAMGIEIDLLATRWNSGDTSIGLVELNDTLRQVSRELDSVNAKVRTELRRLRSEPARGSKTGQEIADLLNAIERRSAIATTFYRNETCDLRPPDDEELCKIAIEAIRNAERHSQASRIEARLSIGRRATELEIFDDGHGVVGWRTGRFGIVGMHERAALIGAHLEIGPASPRGTAVRLYLRTVEP